MGDSLPQYHFPCLAPDSTASNAIFLAGVDNTSTLQIHRVNLANVINPLLTPLLQQTNRTLWAANKPLTCNVFDADRFRFGGGAPMVLTQVSGESTGTTEKGAPLTMAVVTNHGTLVWTHAAAGPWRVANGLYSNTGASNKYLWYTGFSSVTEGDGAKSGWFASVVTDDESGMIYSFQLSSALTTTPLLSVGTYAATSQLPATGFLSVFDENGGGFTYTVNSGVAIDNTTNIQSLSNPTKIKMNGIKLTKDAFPVAMGTKGYIVDKASSGATILYSIQPGSTENPELQRVSVIGQVPPFLRKRASTSLGTQLVFYGGWDESDAVSTTFHVYDTITNSWGGSGLVPAPPTPTNSSGGSGIETGSGTGGGGTDPPKKPINLAGIVGGSLTGLVVLAFGLFLAIRYRRRRRFHFGQQVESAVSDDDERWHRSGSQRPLVDPCRKKKRGERIDEQGRHPHGQVHGVGQGEFKAGSIPLTPMINNPQSPNAQRDTVSCTSLRLSRKDSPSQTEATMATPPSSTGRNPQTVLGPTSQQYEAFFAPSNNPQYIPPSSSSAFVGTSLTNPGQALSLPLLPLPVPPLAQSLQIQPPRSLPIQPLQPLPLPPLSQPTHRPPIPSQRPPLTVVSNHSGNCDERRSSSSRSSLPLLPSNPAE